MASVQPASRTAATPRRRFVRACSLAAWLGGAALALGMAGCVSEPTAEEGATEVATTLEVNTETNATDPPAEAQPSDSPAPTEAKSAESPVGLSDDDVSGLLWMREEEQLAHDVYTVLGDVWGLGIFHNIAEAEQRHVERVAGLLERYGIEDPMAGHVTGSFTIPEIQALYDQVVAAGSESSVDALEVGALIEETDIADLRRLASDVAGIQVAYTELEQGSQNHLRAFVRQLDSRGAGYEPDVLDPAEFDEIVAGR